MSPAPADRVDRLYQLPLDEFTAERNALAAELRAAGDREAASEVKSLRKPSRAAWAANQLVHAEPDLVEALLGAGGELRQAHRQAASGRGAQQLRAAADAERAAVEQLLARAPAVLGADPAPALRETIRNTLRAASSDDDARALIASGRLVEELRPVGLGPVPAGGSRAKAAAPKESAADVERARRLREARARESALRREAEAAERALQRAEEALARARESAERAGDRAVEARKRVRSAAAALRQAEKQAQRLAR
ncbi:MAG: hypothetical protein ACJ76Z_04030 [Thermoleophilaceae bacterium]